MFALGLRLEGEGCGRGTGADDEARQALKCHEKAPYIDLGGHIEKRAAIKLLVAKKICCL